MDLFFTASKVFWFLVAPSNALVLVAGLGLGAALVRLRRLGLGLFAVSVAGFVIVGFSPLANYLMNPLEERFPIHRGRSPSPASSFLAVRRCRRWVWPAASRPSPMRGAGHRLRGTGAAVSGGAARLRRRQRPAALRWRGHRGAHDADDRAGPRHRPERVEYEEKSRNTAENATFAKEVLKPKPGDRWLLVTSAFHMPRAVGSFRKAGFDVIPIRWIFAPSGRAS